MTSPSSYKNYILSNKPRLIFTSCFPSPPDQTGILFNLATFTLTQTIILFIITSVEDESNKQIKTIHTFILYATGANRSFNVKLSMSIFLDRTQLFLYIYIIPCTLFRSSLKFINPCILCNCTIPTAL